MYDPYRNLTNESKEVGLDSNTEKSTSMFTSRHLNAVANMPFK
jgi:hypothetical protein